MPAHRSYAEESRSNWGTSKEGKLTYEQITLGALLRIADATEKMALNHDRLVSDLEHYKKRTRGLCGQMERLNRSNSALRGHITRLKKAGGGN